MAGSILGQDQVAKVNASYPRLLAHINDILSKDNSPHGLMKVHFLTEYLDTTELAAIFAGLPFLSPAEKRALVRAAIYEVVVSGGVKAVVVKSAEVNVEVLKQPGTVELAPTFNPPQLNLNVNRSQEFTGQKPADTNVAKPVTMSTHNSTVSKQVQEGNDRMTKAAAEAEAAFKKIQETPADEV